MQATLWPGRARSGEAILAALEWPWGIAVAAFIGLALYVGVLTVQGIELGFPLDDSWIHQTFARNIAHRHEFAYNQGEPATGSTSPLWTILLVPGHVLPLGYHAWTYLLGGASLAAAGLLSRQLCLRCFRGERRLASLVGFAVVLEWHLAWSAASGMETPLFTAAVLAMLVWWDRGPVAVGALGAGATLLRPEGLIAFLLVLAARALAPAMWHRPLALSDKGPSSRGRLWRALAPLLSFVVMLAPYLLFNIAAAGQPLPTTFYAKNAAYGQALTLSLLGGYTENVISLLFFGPLLILVPGLGYGAGLAVRRLAVLRGPWQSPKGMPTWRPVRCQEPENPSSQGRRPPADELGLKVTDSPGAVHSVIERSPELASADRGSPARALWPVDSAAPSLAGTWVPITISILWGFTLAGLYLVRLPVLYHHGRYLFPLFPVLVVFGLWGTWRLATVLPLRLFAKVFAFCAVAYYVTLWIDGGVSKYAWDVKFINEEQVTTALWLRDHTAAGDIVATHDIGAIGFFSGRRIVDTAGLITPALSNRVRNQEAIVAFVKDSGAAYFAMFPKWYPKIAQSDEFATVYRIDQEYAAAAADNMIVLKLR